MAFGLTGTLASRLSDVRLRFAFIYWDDCRERPLCRSPAGQLSMVQNFRFVNSKMFIQLIFLVHRNRGRQVFPAICELRSSYLCVILYPSLVDLEEAREALTKITTFCRNLILGKLMS